MTRLSFTLVLLVLPILAHAATERLDTPPHSFYLGGIGGFGTTTWEGLVPNRNNQNEALNLSTPIQVYEGGGTLGAVGGFEFSPNFALEATYMAYPVARIVFNEFSLFSYEHNGLTEFITHTESINLMGKVMVFFPSSDLRFFSSVGAAYVHRKDILVNDWSMKPAFGLGLNYPIHKHLMAELAGNYSAGYGESLLNPASSYIPFLTSITLRLVYMFH